MFTVDAFPAREFNGKVKAVYPKAVIQDNVVNYDVVVQIISPFKNKLRPDMTANVVIFLETRKDVLAIPTTCVQRISGRNVTFVLKDDTQESREIKIGWRDRGWVEVAAGLREGETVLLTSNTRKQAGEEP